MAGYPIQIFLNYAREDQAKVESLYQRLSQAGFKPWMDNKDILPGEKWSSTIQNAIRSSDFFLACLSQCSVNKRGFLQKEIRDAVEIWQEKLESDIYLIPVLLESCQVPEPLGSLQWVDLQEEEGWRRLLKAFEIGIERLKIGTERRPDLLGDSTQPQVSDETLFRNFWQLDEGQEKLFCAISTLADRDTGLYKRRVTGFGEVRGYASVVYSLARAYEKGIMKDERLYFSADFPDDITREQSLVLLGGDDKNKVTRDMIRQIENKWGIELPCKFDYESETKLVFQFAGKDGRIKRCEYLPKIDEWERDGEKQRRIFQDFGIIARLPNPFNLHSRLFIFAGCHTYGTAAAAKSVAVRPILQKMENTFGYYPDSKFFIAIISCNVSGNYYYVDDIELFCPLNEDTFDPISRGIFVRKTKHCVGVDV